MKFTKMQGLGNDYLYVYGEVPENIVDLSVRLSDRHFGAGSDGMIYISPSDKADFMMRIFNADGSEAKMCGNGIRCVGKYVYDKGYTSKKELKIDTQSGIKYLTLVTDENNKVKEVTVDMGKGVFEDEKTLNVSGEELKYIPVSMGNPHAVFFTDDINKVALDSIGPLIEHHEVFPGGVNAEFVEVIFENEIRMRVWERGSGITMACGTGACASVCACIKKGFCKYNDEICVRLDGGDLYIKVTEDNTVYMRGPAVTVYDAEVDE
ncbi:MAG: diaminopimelate epimerase [Lachnospiraceae bacterium]|jgi:diaminopimelate epimerase|nr:diaminopimelate epimerase [Lachnospiraceae bacterium]